jgi:hypothetical protein
MPASNGGMQQTIGSELIANGTSLFFFDPTNFNDPNSGSFYNFKVEDAIAGRTATINRVILSYRDLGVARIMLALSGVIGPSDPLHPNKPTSSISPLINIGTVGASQVICTLIYGLTISAANLQLSVVRPANGGPVSITKVRMEGKVETTTY